ncbi:MAG: hypothetical protein NZ866_00530 [Patescibacteria group bacterium]|nr:hypothetical protein [Patescibacteria group bacterium]
MGRYLIIGSSKINVPKLREASSIVIETAREFEAPSLERVGNLILKEARSLELPNLKIVENDIVANKVEEIDRKDLGSLEEVGGVISFENARIVNLPKLKKVGGKNFLVLRLLNLRRAREIIIPELEIVDGIFNADQATVIIDGSLKEINGDFHISNDLQSLEIFEKIIVRGRIWIKLYLGSLQDFEIRKNEALIKILEDLVKRGNIQNGYQISEILIKEG